MIRKRLARNSRVAYSISHREARGLDNDDDMVIKQTNRCIPFIRRFESQAHHASCRVFPVEHANPEQNSMSSSETAAFLGNFCLAGQISCRSAASFFQCSRTS